MSILPENARHFPATVRNRNPIASILKQHLPLSGTVLEIGSGSGEHSVYFADIFPNLIWQPSDPDPLNVESINAWVQSAAASCSNLRPPLSINASDLVLPVASADFVICINVIHISPWDATKGLMRNAANLLPESGGLYLYGPYKIDGVHTSPSNASFDCHLRSQNDTWGVRDLGDVVSEAHRNGLYLKGQFKMPANNLSIVFEKKLSPFTGCFYHPRM